MKMCLKSSSNLLGLVIATVILFAVSHATATSKYWQTTPGAGNGGGTGNWGTNNLTFSTTSGGDATLTIATNGDDLFFQGTAGTVTVTNNLPFSGSFNSITFNTTGYTLTPDSSSRYITNAGVMTIGAGMTLNLLNSAATGGQTLGVGSITNGDATSQIIIQGAASKANADRINISAPNSTISVPTTISESGKGVAGYVATATGAVITGNITNNSANNITDIGATGGNDLTVNAIITGNAPVSFSAGNTGGAGTVILEQQNTYTGATTFNAAGSGVVKLGVANALPTTTDVTWASGQGGILDLNGFSLTIGSLQSTNASGYITNSSAAIGTNVLAFSGSTSPPNSFDQNIKDGATSKIAITYSGTGSMILSGNNTFTGPITITGGSLGFNGDTAFGANTNSFAANAIVIDGGKLTIETKNGNGQIYTLNPNRGIQVGSTAGTAISVISGGALTYNGIVADKPSSTGVLAKQGGGVLILGGVNTYSGGTFANNGTLQLTNGDNRLPTGTTVAIGQTGDKNLGTLDLNGYNQQVAGLNSGSGTNITTVKNMVTNSAATPVTLTISGSGNYSCGDGSLTNSGIIAGPINLVMNGSGTQTLGDTNTYTGNTTILQGTLAIGANGVITNSPLIEVAGGATFDISALTAGLTLNSSETLNAGGTTSAGTIATGSNPGLALGATSPLLFSAFNGATPPLTITGSGAITLASGNIVTVTNVSGSPFAAGNYKLISTNGAGGGVNGGVPSSVAVNGNGIAVSTTASLIISNSELYLNVSGGATGSPSTNSISFSGTTATIGILGSPNTAYVLLTTTNLLSGWSPINTNSTDVNGLLNFTNSNATNQQQFYRTMIYTGP